MYFVGEEAIADTDITQVSFVLFPCRLHAVTWQAVSGKILVQLLLVEFLLPMP